MKAPAAARHSINSTVGLQKSFPAADHNDNIIQSELLITLTLTTYEPVS